MPAKTKGTRRTRRAAAVAGVLSALAIAAPVAGASAATTPAPYAGLPAYHLPAFDYAPYLANLASFHPGSLSFVGPSVGQVAVAIGPTVIGSVFNGGTTVVVSNGPAVGSVNGSP